jgi:hypothetical protein
VQLPFTKSVTLADVQEADRAYARCNGVGSIVLNVSDRAGRAHECLVKSSKKPFRYDAAVTDCFGGITMFRSLASARGKRRRTALLSAERRLLLPCNKTRLFYFCIARLEFAT